MKKKKITKNIAIILSLSVITGSMPLSQNILVSAAGKTTLSASKMTLAVGGEKTLKLKNNKKKTIWKITAGKKYIRLKNEEKNSVKIAGIKAGTARVQVKAGKAKYACKVIVKEKVNPNTSEQATLAPQVIAPVESTKPAESIKPTNLPQKTIIPEPADNNRFEKYIGKCADISDILQEAEYDEEGDIQMTDIQSADKNVSDTMITNEEDVWVNCGDKTIKELEKSFSFYFEQSDITYSVTYIDECCQESRIENEPDNVGFLKLQAIRTMEDGSVRYKNYYIIKQVHAFVSFSGKANGITLDGEDFETYDKTYCLYDFEGNIYHALEIGKKYDVYIPFDALDMGDDVIVGSYTADCVKRDAAVYESDFEIVKKDSGDVAALKELIQQQKNAGAFLNNNINIRNDYVWKDGRLIKIQWDFCYLRGEISFSDLGALQTIDCAGNSLTQIDISGNKALSNLSCGENKISQLDISNNTALTELSCNDNKLSELNLEENKQLETLNCESNKLTQLDLSKNGEISWLSIASNHLSSIDLNNLTKLERLDCAGNVLTELKIEKCGALKSLDCGDNKLTSLLLTNNISLEELWCYYNQLENMDVSQCPLKILQCNNNELNTLNLGNNEKLTDLYCSENKLEILDIGNCQNLQYFDCAGNMLKSLDTGNNKKLKTILCHENQLKELFVGANQDLEILDCDKNQITLISIADNTMLKAVCWDENVTIEGINNREFEDAHTYGMGVGG